MKYKISPPKSISGSVNLPVSKSILNRYLTLCHLSNHDLPAASANWPEDVKVFYKALSKKGKEINVNDAGTAMRFVTAILSISNENFILKGSDRMHERPIGQLVSALKEVGADIKYLEKLGFPPLQINGKTLKGGNITLPVDVSSQFLSAVLMIAPLTKEGIEIECHGKKVSAPYIDLTIKMMHDFGVKVLEEKNKYIIRKQIYNWRDFSLEKDWSSAAFIYQICALMKEGNITLPGLSLSSSQGDVKCREIYGLLGVKSREVDGGIELRKSELFDNSIELMIDFTDVPDLVQGYVMTCFALNIRLKLLGLYNLHLKESNRLEALRYNVESLGGKFVADCNEAELFPAKSFKENAELKVFNDHRMAMALAPLSLKIKDIIIPEIEAVKKSFPEFWKELQHLGFNLIEMP